MNCPKCQAKLIPVDGEMFCLQCGTAVAMKHGADTSGPALEDTTDPLLQKAINDATGKPVKYKSLEAVTVAPEPQPKAKAFTSMRAVLAPPRAVLTGGGTAAMARSPVPLVPEKEPEKKPEEKKPAETVRVETVKVETVKPAAGVPAVVPRRSLSFRWHAPSPAWTAGIAVFGLFLLINAAVYNYYSSRVFPGVKVGNVDLGGLPLGELHHKLAGMASPAKLTVEVGPAKLALDTKGLGEVDVGRTEREVKAIGHNTPMPLAGLAQSLTSKPLQLQPAINDAAAQKLVAQVTNWTNHKPSDAAAMVVGGQAFAISDKSGGELSAATVLAAIKSAYGKKSTLTLSPQKLAPSVTASAYAADIQSAQEMLSVALQIKVRTATYNPTAAQIGSWLVFNGPGKGITVNGAGVAAYVATLPGTFDRAKTVNAVLAAVRDKKSLVYTASTKKTGTPKLADVGAALPIRTYSYCSSSENALVNEAGGWGLGGKIKFARVESGCNFSLELMAVGSMGSVDPACAGRATCQVGNVLAISLDSWTTPPSWWKSGLDSYRTELVNHEVGHWLGFDHGSCSKPADAPVLTAPTLVVPGCSPNWYPVPFEVQGTKLLASFE